MLESDVECLLDDVRSFPRPEKLIEEVVDGTTEWLRLWLEDRYDSAPANVMDFGLFMSLKGGAIAGEASLEKGSLREAPAMILATDCITREYNQEQLIARLWSKRRDIR